MRSRKLDDPSIRLSSQWSRVWICLVWMLFLSSFVHAQDKTLDLKTSTQFLWGDDLLGEGQSIIAQYLRLNYKPRGQAFYITGYGRVWKDFTNSDIRDDSTMGKLYYLYLDYSPFENTSLKLGRQFVNFTAGSAILDGIRLEVSSFDWIGITFAEGADVRFSLDSTDSNVHNHFIGVNLRLQNVRATQLGMSYVRRYDDWDTSREEFGLNFRRSWNYLSPYGEIRYDRISEDVDETLLGLDLFPVTNLMLKGEFYHSFPTFDTTSIYSVFATERYDEYLIQADYSLSAPLALLASYTRQVYGDNDHANVYTVGASVYPVEHLALKISVDRRTGYAGRNWGFEANGDYKLRDQVTLSAGAQYDMYKRPEEFSENYATRYWLGGQWRIRKEASMTLRLEDNVNENFKHRPLGRVTLDWAL